MDVNANREEQWVRLSALQMEGCLHSDPVLLQAEEERMEAKQGAHQTPRNL